MLPLVHSTSEELAHHLFVLLLREFSLPYLHSRGVTDMEISVAELPRQEVRVCTDPVISYIPVRLILEVFVAVIAVFWPG